MRVSVDWDNCESNGMCMGEAPEVFLLKEDDELEILQEEPAEELRPKVERAVRACPKTAVRLEG